MDWTWVSNSLENDMMRGWLAIEKEGPQVQLTNSIFLLESLGLGWNILDEKKIWISAKAFGWSLASIFNKIFFLL